MKKIRLSYNCPVILTYFFISFIALVLCTLFGDRFRTFAFSLYRTSFADIFSYFRLITFSIGHMNFIHFINNFMIILITGPVLEEKYGSKNLLKMLIITSLTTGIISLIIYSNSYIIGSSAISFMLILLCSFTNIKRGYLPLSTILVFVIFIGKEIINIRSDNNISELGHVIGGLIGIVFGLIFTNKTSKY